MEKKKTVSVSDFAKMAGKPKAEVYRLIGNSAYKEYVSVEDGVKVIDLQLLDVLRGESPRNEKPKEEEKREFAETMGSSSDIASLSAEIDRLHSVIVEKDKQIQELSLKLAEMAITSQSITEKALNAVNQQQILTAITTKKLPWYKRLLGSSKEE